MKKENAWWKNIQYLLSYLVKWDNALIANYVIFTISSIVVPFVGLYLTRYIIMCYTLIPRRLDSLGIFLFLFVGIILQGSVIVTNGNIMKKSSFINMNFSRMLQEKSISLPYFETKKQEVLDKLSKAQSIVRNFGSGIGTIIQSAFRILQNIVVIIGYVVVLSQVSILLPIGTFILLAIGYQIRFSAQKYEHSQSDSISDFTRKVYTYHNFMQDASYGKEIRIYNLASFLKAKYKLYYSQLIDIYIRIRKKHFKGELIDTCINGLVEIGAFLFIVASYLSNVIEIADFTMMIATVVAMNFAIKELMKNIGDIAIQNLYIQDLIDFLEYKTEDTRSKETAELPEAPYSIEFCDVSFRYPGSERYILRHFNLKTEKAERISIVGPNGAGKTTIIQILCRLFDIEEGDVLINDVSIYRIPIRAYWTIFSCVFQQSNLLSYTIADNIAAQEPDYQRLWDVLQKTNMAEKVRKLAKRENSVVSRIFDEQGIVFSGGEVQRLGLARALYKNGSIIILDEPTSSLDPLAEQNVYTRINEMLEQKKLAFFISHRLASTRFCDRIILLEDGKVIETGTHDMLIKQNGRYAKIFSVQANEYR